MEDPWGSPWTADADSSGGTGKPAAAELEPPPRALLTTTAGSSLGIPAFSYNSPWGQNDDDFGDWSSADPVAGAAASGSLSVWGGWPGDNGTGATSSSQPHSPAARSRENSIASLGSRSRSRDGSIAKASSPIAWPINAAAASPGIRSLSRQSSNAGLRFPGLDPWASESTHSLDLPPSPPKVATPRVGLEQGPVTTPRFDPVDDASLGAVEPHLTTIEQEPTITPGLLEAKPALAGQLEFPSPGWGEADGQYTGAQAGTGGAEEETPHHDALESAREEKARSRASSSCSEGSAHDEGRQDSPITSIDEDSKSRAARPSTQRKVSNKVQDLVVMYDGIAKTASAEPLPPERHTRAREPGDPRPSTAGSSVMEQSLGAIDGGTAGEDGLSNSGQSPSRTRRSQTPQKRPATPVSRHRPTSSGTSTTHRETPPKQTPERVARFRELVAKFGPVEFVPDLKSIDLLFSNKAELDAVAPPEGVDTEIPDWGVVTDNFTMVSERRAWYLTSRQGTARMHNAGGEEFYRRTTWPSSDVRAETIKIVRRWMEEDSMSGGRATLGGGSNGHGKGKGNMFGWGDSSSAGAGAEPLRVHEVFARRRKQRLLQQQQQNEHLLESAAAKRPQSLVLPRRNETSGTGAAAAPSAHQPGDGGGAAASIRPFSTADAVAGFSWSSSPTVESKPASLNGFAIGGGGGGGGVASSRRPQPVVLPAADDDDDWGEMISSPAPVDGGPPGPSFPAPSAAGPLAGVQEPPALHNEPAAGISAVTNAPPPPAVPPPPPAAKKTLPTAAPAPDIESEAAAVAGATSGQEDEEELVRAVIQSLPDLSYMLR